MATSSSKTAGSTDAARAHVVSHQPGEGALQLVGRGRVGELGDPLDTVTEQADVAAGEGDHDVDDRRLFDRVESTDRSEVDEAEFAPGQNEHVARVRISVEHADPDDLVEGGAQQLVGEPMSIHVGLVQTFDIGNRDTIEALLNEDPPRREVSVHRRDSHRRAVAEKGGHLTHRVRLVTEVDLPAQADGELGEQVSRADSLAERRAPLGHVGEQCESSEIALHHHLDVGPLHLDHHRLA